MADPAVALSLRTDGADPVVRDRAWRNVVAITVRPSFAPADLAMLHVVPTAPRPSPTREHAVRRAKPAKGRNTIRSRFLADATRELFERLGECERRVVRGSVVLRWDLGEGDGIVVARKSTDEAKDGETIGAQLGAVLRYCDEAGHKPRIVLAVLNLSGRTEFEDRHDFTEVFESFRRGEVSWVAYRGMDRLGRSMPSTTQFVHWLRRYGIGLHIAQLHKAVDLHNPFEVSLLWTLASGAELESAMSGERLLTALNGQMRDAGKGWARSGGFGFCRGDENFIVVNEEEWPYTILVHELYATLRSIAAVKRTLETENGLCLADGTIHKILRDERYRTGEFRTKDSRAESGYTAHTVHLSRPIPKALWDHNQMLLDAKNGKATKTPEAQFVTRGIPVYHARCMDPDDPSRSADQLSSRTRRGTYRFVHESAEHRGRKGYRVPESCRGYTLAVELVERAVIRGVRAMLEDNHDLHRAIALGRANREPIEDGGLFTPDDQSRLNRELRRLERYRDGLWHNHLDRVRGGQRTKRDHLEEELQLVDAEITDIRRQLKLDTQLRRRKPRSTPIPSQIKDVLTEDPPADAEHRLRRWAIVHELVTQVIVHDTDDGVVIELFGPLVPPEDDPAGWDPVQTCSSVTDSVPALPEVPQPFRNPAIPERLVHAYRWRCALDVFASEPSTCKEMLAALRELAAQHPTGPIFGVQGIGAVRWKDAASRRHLPVEPHAVYQAARREGTTPASLVRQAVGARSAVIRGRVTAESRDEVVWIMEAAIRDGFDFGPSWTDRVGQFGRDKPYRFGRGTIYKWAKAFADGDLAALIDDAQALAAADRA